MDEPTSKRNTWPHESPPARAELDAEKAAKERHELMAQRMRRSPETMAEYLCQLEDDLAALRVELRREKQKKS